ncbi:MAG TPA: hemerythrin domain-containing protein [Gaiellaceae bacterium]|nr:hemerythrin domain-containing protein [Gaiellaceae bacterium]
MKRHRALVPLSHDHHHALVEARRLRRAADGPEPREAGAAFLAFFAAETVHHFREEEELVFPLTVGFDEAREPLVRVLLEHQRLHALVAELEAGLADGGPVADELRQLGELLEAHVRFEERELFPLIERLVAGEALESLPLAARDAAPDSAPQHGRGPVWGAESEDLNATLLAWGPGSGPPEHVNAERDVLVAVLDGSATVALDGEERQLDPGAAIIIGKGRARRITAGPEGVRYLSVHRRRPPLQIDSRLSPAQPDEA